MLTFYSNKIRKRNLKYTLELLRVKFLLLSTIKSFIKYYIY